MSDQDVIAMADSVVKAMERCSTAINTQTAKMETATGIVWDCSENQRKLTSEAHELQAIFRHFAATIDGIGDRFESISACMERQLEVLREHRDLVREQNEHLDVITMRLMVDDNE